MNSREIKLIASATVAMLIVLIIPLVGLTTIAQDNREGLMIDFGYWDVVWTDVTFNDDMDGVEILEVVCDINGYPEPVFTDPGKTILFSVNGQQSLVGATWNFYVLDEGKWKLVEDPHSVKVSEQSLVCWSRTADGNNVIKGTDASDFTYYSYAKDGVSLKTGEKLRVVTLAPSLTEMVASVGGTGNIVGTDSYSDYPQAVVDGQRNGTISYIGGYADPNYEWIMRLSPDIVFCDGGTGEHVSMANKLRKSGINCVVTYNSTDIETLYDNMWIVAAAIGLEENANKAIHSIRSSMDSVAGIIGMQQAKKVFVSLSAQPSPWTAGSDTFINDVISKASGRNIFAAQQSSWFMVAKESIHFSQPQVIIIIYEGREITTEDQYNAVLNSLDPLWKETPAFRSGNVILFTGDSADILSRPGPRLAEAYELISKILFPQQFISKDPLDVVPKYFANDYERYLKYQKEGIF